MLIFFGSPLLFFPFLWMILHCRVQFCIVMNTKVIRVLGQFIVHLKVEQRQHVCTITMHSNIDAINAMQWFAMAMFDQTYIYTPMFVDKILIRIDLISNQTLDKLAKCFSDWHINILTQINDFLSLSIFFTQNYVEKFWISIAPTLSCVTHQLIHKYSLNSLQCGWTFLHRQF